MKIKREQINIRDPFILLFENTYYMYSSFDNAKVCYYKSKDLENWEFGDIVFEIPKKFWAYKDAWAPEVHEYKGKFYLFYPCSEKTDLEVRKLPFPIHRIIFLFLWLTMRQLRLIRAA